MTVSSGKIYFNPNISERKSCHVDTDTHIDSYEERSYTNLYWMFFVIYHRRMLFPWATKPAAQEILKYVIAKTSRFIFILKFNGRTQPDFFFFYNQCKDNVFIKINTTSVVSILKTGFSNTVGIYGEWHERMECYRLKHQTKDMLLIRDVPCWDK